MNCRFITRNCRGFSVKIKTKGLCFTGRNYLKVFLKTKGGTLCTFFHNHNVPPFVSLVKGRDYLKVLIKTKGGTIITCPPLFHRKIASFYHWEFLHSLVVTNSEIFFTTISKAFTIRWQEVGWLCA